MRMIAACLLACASLYAQTYKLKPVVTGGLKIPTPLFVTHAGDPSVIYVVRQSGVIYAVRITGDTFKSKPLLDIRTKVNIDMEGGLIGLAFHPGFAKNGKFYVAYTTGPEYSDQFMNVLSEFTAKTPGSDSAEAGSEKVLITFSHPWPYHHMSSLAFGPDGYLYAGLGDGGTPVDANRAYLDPKSNLNAQDLSQLKGGFLRLDVDHPAGGKPYGIPADNPLAGNTKGYKEERWAWGVRYPWRFSFDRATGEIWAGNVGQSWYEEVLHIEKGKNYGWPRTEGDTCLFTAYCDSAFQKEEFSVHRSGKGFAVIGGYVYRGGPLPELNGTYVYGDYVSGQIWGLKKNAQGAYVNTLLAKASGKVTSFGEDAEGNVYVTTFGPDGVFLLWRDGAMATRSPPAVESMLPRVIEAGRPFKVSLRLARAGRVTARVVSPRGLPVKTIFDGEAAAGALTLGWAGEDEAGRLAARGVYLLRVQAGTEHLGFTLLAR